MAGTSTRENGLKETVTLKWCTPRTNSIGGNGQLKFLLLFHLLILFQALNTIRWRTVNTSYICKRHTFDLFRKYFCKYRGYVEIYDLI